MFERRLLLAMNFNNRGRHLCLVQSSILYCTYVLAYAAGLEKGGGGTSKDDYLLPRGIPIAQEAVGSVFCAFIGRGNYKLFVGNSFVSLLKQMVVDVLLPSKQSRPENRINLKWTRNGIVRARRDETRDLGNFDFASTAF